MAVIEFGFIFLRDLTVKNYMSQMVQRIERGQVDISQVATALTNDGLMANRNPQVCTEIPPAPCTGDTKLPSTTTLNIGDSVTVGVRYDLVTLTPVGKLLNFTFPSEIIRHETVIVGSASKLSIDYSTCRYVSDKGGPPNYTSTVNCGSDEVMVNPGGRCEVPGADLCAGSNRGYMHSAVPTEASGIWSYSVDCYGEHSAEACSQAYAFCCALKLH